MRYNLLCYFFLCFNFIFCFELIPLNSQIFAQTQGEFQQQPREQHSEPGKTSKSLSEKVSGTAKHVLNTGIEGVLHPWIFANLHLGAAQLKTNHPDEVDKNGYAFSLLGSMMFDFKSFIAEGGGGYVTASLEGSDSKTKNQSANIGVLTSFGSVRYLIDRKWQIGGGASWIFGAETDFGPVEKANEHNLLANLDVYYHAMNLNAWRIGLHYSRDTTIKTRDYSTFSISYSYGFPVITPQTKNPPAALPEIKPVSTTQHRVGEDNMIFALNSYTLTDSASAYATKVAETLLEHSNQWDVIEIYTYRESSESDPEGKDLSLLRGYALKGHLVASGISEDRIKVVPQGLIKRDDMSGQGAEIAVLGKEGSSNISDSLKQMNDSWQDRRIYIYDQRLVFETSKAELSPQGIELLDRITDLIIQNTSQIEKIVIYGHTDASGPSEKNITLANSRAKSANDYLQKKYINTGLIESIGRSSKYPIIKDDPLAALNRRVELIIALKKPSNEISKEFQDIGILSLNSPPESN